VRTGTWGHHASRTSTPTVSRDANGGGLNGVERRTGVGHGMHSRSAGTHSPRRRPCLSAALGGPGSGLSAVAAPLWDMGLRRATACATHDPRDAGVAGAHAARGHLRKPRRRSPTIRRAASSCPTVATERRIIPMRQRQVFVRKRARPGTCGLSSRGVGGMLRSASSCPARAVAAAPEGVAGQRWGAHGGKGQMHATASREHTPACAPVPPPPPPSPPARAPPRSPAGIPPASARTATSAPATMRQQKDGRGRGRGGDCPRESASHGK